MADTRNVRLITKRTSVPGKIPTGTTGDESSYIRSGELASNLADHSLWGYDGANVFEYGSSSFLKLTGGTISGNIFVTGGFSATTFSGGTILSGATNLYNIFSQTDTITRIQPGTNTTTGGTANAPTVNVTDSPSLNGLTLSGTGQFAGVTSTSLSATTLSANNLTVNGPIYFSGEMFTTILADGIWFNGRNDIDTNTSFGRAALVSSTLSGLRNTAVGRSALRSTTTGQQNTAIGNAAMDANLTGEDNTAVGVNALNLNIAGTFNTAIGSLSMRLNLSGNSNSSLGYGTLFSMTGASSNVAIGNLSQRNNVNGNNNVSVGTNALMNNVSGANNTNIGTNAGQLIANGSNLTAATTSTLIGYNTRALAQGASNENVFGSNAVGNGSNTTTIGSSANTSTYINGRVNLNNISGTPVYNLAIDANGFVVTASTAVNNTFCSSGITTSMISGCSSTIDVASNLEMGAGKNIIGELGAGTGISLGASGASNLGTWNQTNGGDFDSTLTLDGDSSIATINSIDSNQNNNAIVGLNANTGIAALAVNMGIGDNASVSLDGANSKVSIVAYEDAGGDTGQLDISATGITATNGYVISSTVSPNAFLTINAFDTTVKGNQTVNLTSQSTSITIDGSNGETNITSDFVNNIISTEFNINGGANGYKLPLTGGTVGQVLAITATGSTATAAWITNSSSGSFIKGTANIDFDDESDSAILTISSSAITAANINSVSFIFIETSETSLDDFNLNGVSFNIENIVDSVSFDIKGTAINNASGIYTIKYSIGY